MVRWLVIGKKYVWSFVPFKIFFHNFCLWKWIKALRRTATDVNCIDESRALSFVQGVFLFVAKFFENFTNDFKTQQMLPKLLRCWFCSLVDLSTACTYSVGPNFNSSFYKQQKIAWIIFFFKKRIKFTFSVFDRIYKKSLLGSDFMSVVQTGDPIIKKRRVHV